MVTTDRRNDVLSMLKSADRPLGITEIADRLGVHPNTVRFHLAALERTGQAERIESAHTKPGRPPLTYRAAPGMDPGGARHYRTLAEILVRGLADQPDPAGAAAAAGRTWGSQIDPDAGAADERQAVDRLADLLDHLGFAPQPRSSGDKAHIGLHNCPFLELAQRHGTVVCAIHLGLMQGALDSWSAPVRVEKLTPFAEPDLCVAHLASAGRRS
jgi:predicted ArsR family transcriptional regulator